MKKACFIFFLLAVSIFISCKKNLNTFILGIDVQSSFNQDSIQVLVDDQSLINKRLQTNHVLGVCYVDGQITTTKNEGRYEIKVIVNNGATKAETFTLKNNLYIGINYDQQTNVISIVYSRQRFIYD